MTGSTEWQRIGEVPVDTGRLVLLDPMNVDESRPLRSRQGGGSNRAHDLRAHHE
jgi:hypothetical protein